MLIKAGVDFLGPLKGGGGIQMNDSKPLFKKLNWMPLTERIQYHTAVLTYKARNFMTPQYLNSKFSTVAGQHGHATCLAQSSDLQVPQPNLELLENILTIGSSCVEQHTTKALAMLIVFKAFKADYCRSVLGQLGLNFNHCIYVIYVYM